MLISGCSPDYSPVILPMVKEKGPGNSDDRCAGIHFPDPAGQSLQLKGTASQLPHMVPFTLSVHLLTTSILV